MVCNKYRLDKCDSEVRTEEDRSTYTVSYELSPDKSVKPFKCQ